MSEKIFSGEKSKEYWRAIRQAQIDILYDYGCKAQEIEQQRDDLLEACKLGLNSMRGLLEIGVEIGASNLNKRKQAEDIRQVEAAIAKCEA